MRLSKSRGINPNFLSALVAQESSFNPKAVSPARALGLTQITPIAVDQLKKTHGLSWKIHPDSRQLSYPELKLAVNMDYIHNQNDWRLDEKKSLLGAMYYIEYLDQYWSKALPVEVDEQTKTDLLTASYNSGPARIKYLFEQDGDNWKSSSKIKEAIKYYKKVKSYCYSFEHGKQPEKG
ncbi:MAG: lytic transglycosylase domain-containing protein [Bacteriovoracaceae bacterium]